MFIIIIHKHLKSGYFKYTVSKRTESPHFLACSYSSNLRKNEEESLLPSSCAIWSLCSEALCTWTYTVQLFYHPNSGWGDNMNELRSGLIRNFQFRKEFKLILNVEPVQSSQNATLPLTCSHVLKQFAGLGPRTQMKVPEEEAGRFVSATTLNSFKNSWCW